MERPEYLKELAAFCSDRSLATLPPEVVDRTRWIIADSIPVIAAGMQMPEMKALGPSCTSPDYGGGIRMCPLRSSEAGEENEQNV